MIINYTYDNSAIEPYKNRSFGSTVNIPVVLDLCKYRPSRPADEQFHNSAPHAVSNALCIEPAKDANTVYIKYVQGNSTLCTAAG